MIYIYGWILCIYEKKEVGLSVLTFNKLSDIWSRRKKAWSIALCVAGLHLSVGWKRGQCMCSMGKYNTLLTFENLLMSREVRMEKEPPLLITLSISKVNALDFQFWKTNLKSRKTDKTSVKDTKRFSNVSLGASYIIGRKHLQRLLFCPPSPLTMPWDKEKRSKSLQPNPLIRFDYCQWNDWVTDCLSEA